jgi:hypothetical protein
MGWRAVLARVVRGGSATPSRRRFLFEFDEAATPDHCVHRMVARKQGIWGTCCDRAVEFVEKHMGGATDAYTLAVIADLAADYGRDREFTQHAVQQLLDARTEKDEQVWWTTDETGVYGTGASAAVETTGLAVQAPLRSGESSGVARKALT